LTWGPSGDTLTPPEPPEGENVVAIRFVVVFPLTCLLAACAGDSSAPAVGSSPSSPPNPRAAPTSAALPAVVTPEVASPVRVEAIDGLLGMKLVRVPAGSFTMGCLDTDPDCEPTERPAHPVTISRPFYVAQTEVTYRQWTEIMGLPAPNSRTAIPGGGPGTHILDVNRKMVPCGSNCAVSNISMQSTVIFLNKLSLREGLEPCYEGNDGYYPRWLRGLDCTGYRLPTEAEWEYAARAGQTTVYSGSDDGEKVAWLGETGESAHVFAQRPVGERAPNAWGLLDMSGNLAERCWDPTGFTMKPYSAEPAVDPVGTAKGTPQMRAVRGGSWRGKPATARVSARASIDVNWPEEATGLRVFRTAGPSNIAPEPGDTGGE
jgi:formylglycine-generating enzyme required for sulfatase activity